MSLLIEALPKIEGSVKAKLFFGGDITVALISYAVPWYVCVIVLTADAGTQSNTIRDINNTY